MILERTFYFLLGVCGGVYLEYFNMKFWMNRTKQKLSHPIGREKQNEHKK